MNPVLMFKLARTGWNRFNDYRAKKAEEAYAALEDIANSSLVDDTRARAGAVTKAAQQRLEDRLSLLADAPSQLRPKKKKRGKKLGIAASVFTGLAVLLGGAYYWLRKNDIPATHPPRVEDFEESAKPTETEESVLVYSTETEEKRRLDNPED